MCGGKTRPSALRSPLSTCPSSTRVTPRRPELIGCRRTSKRPANPAVSPNAASVAAAVRERVRLAGSSAPATHEVHRQTATMTAFDRSIGRHYLRLLCGCQEKSAIASTTKQTLERATRMPPRRHAHRPFQPYAFVSDTRRREHHANTGQKRGYRFAHGCVRIRGLFVMS